MWEGLNMRYAGYVDSRNSMKEEERNMKDEAEKGEVTKVTETPEERFKRIANLRVNKTLDSLRILSNMGTAPGYEYTDEDVAKIFSTIDKAVEKAKIAFEKEFNEKFKL